MPFVGQNIYNSSPVNSRQSEVQRIQQVRGGEWGRVQPERSSASKYYNAKNHTTEVLRSGQKFSNNVIQKQAEHNQRSISSWMQKKQAIDQG